MIDIKSMETLRQGLDWVKDSGVGFSVAMRAPWKQPWRQTACHQTCCFCRHPQHVHISSSCISFRSGAPSPLSKVSCLFLGCLLFTCCFVQCKAQSTKCVHSATQQAYHTLRPFSFPKNQSPESWNSNAPCLLTSAPVGYRSFYICKYASSEWIQTVWPFVVHLFYLMCLQGST